MAANLRRPMQLIWQRPIIQVIALIMALNFGVYCLLLSTLATLWINRYGQSEFISTLHYIAVSLGTTVATQAGGRFMDWVFAKQKARSPDGSTSPEFRVPCLVPPVILIPIGLLWYGWAAEIGAHWLVVDAGVAVFVCGSFLLAQAMLAYLLDEFSHAASANAASRMLSNVLGFVFPIFAPQLFARLGYGWGNSMLAFLFIGLGCPVPLLLRVWGARLRAMGRS
ncbi:putative electron transfer flavoprotein subunit alpha, mitochondrial [Colletotrichum spaethianum]|uniref:Electron transfer flavoprotein subunit alpha, mitochondrial n=1 Tax=Colletotrichum spaethianum TaxID=700344 RepID=A0AA37PGK3_9PEZI|nr:putative electron transfer flavoprotein subunit alpha, mitochondrial [Colletotrichum spaethianum]GKT51762.1 putative electron transfer flavoprotein subunit alpha, mitochondrial [Colletotrichum spaethianum]